MAKEEAIKQVEQYEESLKQSDRVSKVKKSQQNSAIKFLENEIEQKNF